MSVRVEKERQPNYFEVNMSEEQDKQSRVKAAQFGHSLESDHVGETFGTHVGTENDEMVVINIDD